MESTMKTLKHLGFFTAVLLILLGLLTMLSLGGKAHGEEKSLFLFSDEKSPTLSATGVPLFLGRFTSFPTDPVADIPWACAYSGVDEIKCAFDNARSAENTQLGTSLPPLTLPSQATWDGMSDGEKALWLINQERIDRGIDPLDQIETNVTGVAQYYADYLLDYDAWGHEEDGRNPWERLDDNPAIWTCHDFLNVAENLAVFVSTGAIPLAVERSVYMWVYDDAGSAWGHRHAILWYPYNDNSGTNGREGFLGIGRANGGPYQGPFTGSWPFAEMIVMNVFDPCETWDYGSTSSSSTTSSLSSTTTTAAQSSSTTTTGNFPSTTTADVMPDCPSERLFGGHSYAVNLLRKFRDDVLSKTPEGRQFIKLYYRLSPLVFKAMAEDKNFEDEIKAIIDDLLPMIEKRLR